MDIQFPSSPISYLQTVTSQKQSCEQTQEVRLSDGMPDIGRVLGSWGQVLLRSKQWGSDLSISAGVMVWVLYESEEDGTPCTLETWVPFQQKFDLPDSLEREGAMHCCFNLSAVEARSTSARKLHLRIQADTQLEAMLEEKAQLCHPEQLPEDIQLLKNTYPVVLPSEAGERSFQLEDTVPMPSVCPPVKTCVYYAVQPRLQEQKVMGDKVVFRGELDIHLLYLDETDHLCTWEHTLPFSQYGELNREYEPDAGAALSLLLTSSELSFPEPGSVQVQAGLVGQYVICRRELLTVVEDAYSPVRPVLCCRENIPLPLCLEQQERKLTVRQSVSAEAAAVADVSSCFRLYDGRWEDSAYRTDLTGRFQVLYYDEDHKLASAAGKWEETWSLPAGEDAQVHICPVGEQPQAAVSPDGIRAEQTLLLQVSTTGKQGLDTICAIEAGQQPEELPERPSLILCRVGTESLWNLAKQTGSTVSAIRTANHLDADPEPGRMLLIPLQL